MLEELDRVEWSRLSHAYGVATDVPDHLRALTGPDAVEAATALWLLDSRLHRDGAVFSATAAAAPFLVEVAGSDAVDVELRAGALLLIGTLAGDRAGDPGAARALLAALDIQRPRLRALLDDPHRAVRVATAGLAGRLAAPPDDWRPRLEALHNVEDDALVRAAYEVAASLAAGRPPDRRSIAAAAAVSVEVAVWQERELSGILGLRLAPAAAGRLGSLLAELAVARTLSLEKK